MLVNGYKLLMKLVRSFVNGHKLVMKPVASLLTVTNS